MNSLWVYLENGWLPRKYIWHHSYEQSNTWYNYSITVEDFSGQFVFEGRRGPTELGDIAIDDIMITDGGCAEAGMYLLRKFRFL